MKTKQEPYALASQLRKDFNSFFKAPDYEKTLATFGDLVWQIIVNGSVQDKKVSFHVNVSPEGNEIVMASETGGYLKTWVYFTSDKIDDCYPILDQLNELVFDQTKEESRKLIHTSMFGNKKVK